MLAERWQALAIVFLFVWLLKSNEIFWWAVIWTLKKNKELKSGATLLETINIKAIQRRDSSLAFFSENLNSWHDFVVKVSKVITAFKSHTALFQTFLTKAQEMGMLSNAKAIWSNFVLKSHKLSYPLLCTDTCTGERSSPRIYKRPFLMHLVVFFLHPAFNHLMSLLSKESIITSGEF